MIPRIRPQLVINLFEQAHQVIVKRRVGKGQQCALVAVDGKAGGLKGIDIAIDRPLLNFKSAIDQGGFNFRHGLSIA